MKLNVIHKIRIVLLTVLQHFHFIPDALYLRLYYLVATGKQLHLNPPRTFNEKIQWLKLYDRRPDYTIIADKIAAKDYARQRIGERHIIPTLFTYKKTSEIDFDKLPEQFVLKCTHDSGSVIVCKDKAHLDRKTAIEKLNNSLQSPYFYKAREWAYRHISPKIICEPLLKSSTGDTLSDYKIYCFGGTPKLIHVDIDRFGHHRKNFYTTKWQQLNLEITFPCADTEILCPAELDKMLQMAATLAEGFPFMRVDFYDADGCLYFGELTPYPGAGKSRIKPDKWDLEMGTWIKLPHTKIHAD